MKEATGADYMATDASEFPIGVRLMFTLVWQQGSDLVAADGSAASLIRLKLLKRLISW